MGEIDEMEKQKSKLAKDLENLRNKHEKEVFTLHILLYLLIYCFLG